MTFGFPSNLALHKLRMCLIGTAVVLGAFALIIIQKYPTLTFSNFGSLKGALTDIGAKGGRTVTQITFDAGEISATLPENNLNIIVTPDAADISHGVRLSDVITSGKRIFGYKYSSRTAALEIAVQERAENGEPLTFSELFPGQFFASDSARSASSFIPDFEVQKNISFLPLSDVTLGRGSRYVMVTKDVGTALQVRGFPYCGDNIWQPKGADGIADTADDEQCDDGNEIDFDSCSNSCEFDVCIGGRFTSARGYATGTSPRSVAIADFNRDGHNDMVTADSGISKASIFLNNGNGTFADRREYAVGSNPQSVTVGDLNKDGKADIVTANASSDTVSVLLGSGDGTFAGKEDYYVGEARFPQSVAIGDLNNDGRLDLVTANNHSDSISVLFGWGNGTFDGMKEFPTGRGPYSVAMMDVNNDGRMDIVTANRDDGSVTILLRQYRGDFERTWDFPTGLDANAIAIADLNNDGNADLAVANARVLSILLGTGTSSWPFVEAEYPMGGMGGPIGVDIADINDDGILDVVANVILTDSNSTKNMVVVLIGNGDGTFSSQQSYAGSQSRGGIATGDLDADGDIDIAVTSEIQYYAVSVLENNCVIEHE